MKVAIAVDCLQPVCVESVDAPVLFFHKVLQGFYVRTCHPLHLTAFIVTC